MKIIGKKKLRTLGFECESYYEYSNGRVVLYLDPKEGTMEVLVSSNITSDIGYAGTCGGVKDEEDLLSLCRLVNG